MELTDTHKRQHNERGYLLLENLLDEREVAIRQSALKDLSALDRPQVKRNTPTARPKTAYAPHAANKSHDALSARHAFSTRPRRYWASRPISTSPASIRCFPSLVTAGLGFRTLPPGMVAMARHCPGP